MERRRYQHVWMRHGEGDDVICRYCDAEPWHKPTMCWNQLEETDDDR